MDRARNADRLYKFTLTFNRKQVPLLSDTSAIFHRFGGGPKATHPFRAATDFRGCILASIALLLWCVWLKCLLLPCIACLSAKAKDILLGKVPSARKGLLLALSAAVLNQARLGCRNCVASISLLLQFLNTFAFRALVQIFGCWILDGVNAHTWCYRLGPLRKACASTSILIYAQKLLSTVGVQTQAGRATFAFTQAVLPAICLECCVFGLEHESFFVFVVLEFVPGAGFGFRLPDRARCTEHPSDWCKARGGDAQLKIGFGFGETSITFWETSLQTRQPCAWASTLFCLTEIQGVDEFLDIFAHFLSWCDEVEWCVLRIVGLFLVETLTRRALLATGGICSAVALVPRQYGGGFGRPAWGWKVPHNAA